MSCLAMHVMLPTWLILLNEPKAANKALTHLTVISLFHTLTKLIFYRATPFYSQTTFPKNWILCLFILWIICWNRFQNRFRLFRFFSELQKKNSETQNFTPGKDIRGHLIQTSHFMPNKTEARKAKWLAQASLASFSLKMSLISPEGRHFIVT